MAWLKDLLARIATSKTLIFNVATLAALILNYLSGIVPPEWQTAISAAIAVVNIVLRFVTTDPVIPPNKSPEAERRLWQEDLLEGIANDDIPIPEAEALAKAIQERELADAKKEAAAP